ncbi:MAG: response regulator transcription factor [Tissierellia bacterium]|nr:response regulator transcription factor [Tissierellia bacterium]
MSDKIKVLLIDDHSVVREGLRLLLELDNRLIVCGEAATLNEGINMIGELKPHVVLLDFKLPDGDGISGCISIKNIFPDIKIIILTAYTEDHLVLEAIRSGVDGYLLKNVEADELVKTIISVYEGESVLDSSVTDIIFNNIKKEKTSSAEDSLLSSKEKEILKMLSLGKTNKEIGAALYISEKTVRNYVSNIFKKINVSNRTEAAAYWIRNRDIK